MPPPEILEGANAKSLLARYAAALKKANTRIILVRDCERLNRRLFTGDKAK